MMMGVSLIAMGLFLYGGVLDASGVSPWVGSVSLLEGLLCVVRELWLMATVSLLWDVETIGQMSCALLEVLGVALQRCSSISCVCCFFIWVVLTFNSSRCSYVCQWVGVGCFDGFLIQFVCGGRC